MSFQARHVMNRASIILNDVGAVRWTAPELRNYLNDALREIAILKPNSVVATINHALVQGTEQTLPGNATLLVRVIKNTASKKAVSVITDREVLDRSIPGWQNSTVLPYQKDVVHVIYDVANPKTFHVAPGNDATGSLEIVVSKLPDLVAAPENNNNLDINSYTDLVELDSLYINPCIDYVVHAALLKDAALAGAAARSQAHYQRFMASIQAMQGGEAAMSINTRASIHMAPGGNN